MHVVRISFKEFLKVRLLELVLEDGKDSTEALTEHVLRARDIENMYDVDLMPPLIVSEPAGRFCVYSS